jgi:hypothetical protein
MMMHATLEGQLLKLSWTDGNSRLWPYSVLLKSVVAVSERIRSILNDVTRNHMRTGVAHFLPYIEQLGRAGHDLFRVLFDAKDNPSAAQDAEEMIRQAALHTELSIFSEVCVPWGFVFGADTIRLKFSVGEISDFDDFWSSRFVLTLRGGRTTRMSAEPRKRADFRMLHALHRDRFNAALDLLPKEQREALEEIVDYNIGNATDWDACREKWEQIRDNDSLLHIFGHSDGARIFLKDEADDDVLCLAADRFRSCFTKRRGTRSATICFLNGCHSGAGPVGESFLDVLFDAGFQGYIGTEAEVSNEFAAQYAAEFMRRLLLSGESVGEVFGALRTQLFPLSLMYSCYAHREFRIGTTRESVHVDA